ncbi:MAG: frataxin domain-containing protein, partial [SAR324 cluster bacterium]|nr:frataxin domain-containing protein [SAR324 cluster bacterium]
MGNKEYFARVSELFERIEEKLDQFEDEIDYDPSPDKLMVNIEKNGKKIVINTQRAIKEIWLAGNSKGW